MASVGALEPTDLLLIQKGPAVLKPQFELTETYDDNITYREEETLSDFKTVVSPGLSLQVGSRTYNYVDFSYFYDRVQYIDSTELNANQHRAALVMRFEKSRFLLEGSDSFSHLSSPIGGGISIEGIMVQRNTFIDDYRLTYDMSDRTALYFNALHSTVDFESGVSLYDSFTLTGTLGFEYDAFSRTSFFGEFYYGMTENDRNDRAMPDYPTADFVGAFIGARGTFTEKLTGTVKAGYEYRWYRGDQESLSAPVFELSLIERFSDLTTLSLTYSRRQRESVQFARSSYTSDSVSLNLLQNIGSEGRLRANFNATYLSSDYDLGSRPELGDSPQFLSGERQDHLVATGLTITYDVKLWLRVFGGYDFEYLDSSAPRVSDYTVNRVSMGLALGY